MSNAMKSVGSGNFVSLLYRDHGRVSLKRKRKDDARHPTSLGFALPPKVRLFSFSCVVVCPIGVEINPLIIRRNSIIAAAKHCHQVSKSFRGSL